MSLVPIRYRSEYYAWQNMKQRCLNPRNKYYHYYGARGIKVCDRWLNSFKNFLEDMGRKPSQRHSLDRKNNDGNYEPKNCRWASRKVQMNNTRKQRDKRIEKMWIGAQPSRGPFKYTGQQLF
jgi:hypothetical protein